MQLNTGNRSKTFPGNINLKMKPSGSHEPETIFHIPSHTYFSIMLVLSIYIFHIKIHVTYLKAHNPPDPPQCYFKLVFSIVDHEGGI